MKTYLAPLFCSVLLFAGWNSIEANAQSPGEKAEIHVAAARAAAYRLGFDFTNVFDVTCRDPRPGQAPTTTTAATVMLPAGSDRNDRSTWFVEPSKVFDNAYFLGSIRESIWAITTSEGLILVNTSTDYGIEESVTQGLRKLGLDPNDIRYVIVTHAHSSIYPGARYLQDTYPSARIVMSEEDWEVLANNDDTAEPERPRKDMVATDGMKLTLGDTTVTIHITPGHTPGTLSLLIPLKDGNQSHLGALVGGQGWGLGRYGIQYWADNAEAITVWGDSLRGWRDITADAGADVYMSIHPFHDKTHMKVHALNFRRPGVDPHPFVNREAVGNHATVISECMNAQLAWRSGGS